MGLQGFGPIIGAVAVADEGSLIAGGVRADRDMGDRPGADPGTVPSRISHPMTPGPSPLGMIMPVPGTNTIIARSPRA